jgi:methyl-accepting chemotaxis protein
MTEGRRKGSGLFSGLGIAAKLAILTLAMVASDFTIFLIASSGFSRLNGIVVQVNQIEGSYIRAADTLQNQCYGLQIFALSQAIDVSSGIKNVGSSSRTGIVSLSNAAKTSATRIEQLDGAVLAPGVRENLIARFADYMKAVDALPGAFDAGKDAANKGIDDVQYAFRIFSNQMDAFQASLRRAGDASEAQSAKMEKAISNTLVEVIAGALLIGVAIAVFIIRSITKPLGSLVASVASIGGGDLRISTGIRGSDELGKIAASVDALVVALRSLVGTAKERLTLLEDSGRGLSSMMSQTGAAVVQINSSINNTGGQLREQSAAVEEVSASIEELARSVDALGSMIANQSSVISLSSAAVEEIIASVESVAANSRKAGSAAESLMSEGREGKARIDLVGDAVAAIVRYSANLGEAAVLITEIAQRTNLLAMNAAIEAAHAGDAGKGFAVVADEIRKLAEQSTSEAKDISSDLGRVSESIDAVRAASTQAVESFASILDKSAALGGEVHSIGSSMAEQLEGGKQVLDGLARLRDITREIERGSGEMAAGNASILGQIQRLTNVNAAVVRNNQEMSSGTSEINQAVGSTIELSSQTSEHIADVMAAMDKFVV